MNKEIIYDQEFFNTTHDHISSASVILNILFKHYNPKSIVDVGCGTGIWLKIAREMSAVSITGVDGTWLKQEMLLSDKIELITHDLEIPLPTLPTFDLAISLEVAENNLVAKNFYKKNKFKKVGYRKKYYHVMNKLDNALIYERKIDAK